MQNETVFILYAENYLGGQQWLQSVHRSKVGAAKEACTAMVRTSPGAAARYALLIQEERYEEVLVAWNAGSMNNRASKFSIVEATLQP